MLAHVYQFGTFGETTPWVYSAIGFGLALIGSVLVYRTLRKGRAHRRRQAERHLVDSGAQPFILGTVVAKCGYEKDGLCRHGYQHQMTEPCEFVDSPGQINCPGYCPF